MSSKSLVIALSVVALALLATVATATYAGNMMTAQRNGANHQMSEEQCENIMQNMSTEQCESMESMHNSEQHSSTMGDSDHSGMMNGNGMGMGSMGSGGCH